MLQLAHHRILPISLHGETFSLTRSLPDLLALQFPLQPHHCPRHHQWYRTSFPSARMNVEPINSPDTEPKENINIIQLNENILK